MPCWLFMPQRQDSQKHQSRNSLTEPLNLFAVQDICKNLHHVSDLSLLIHYLQQRKVNKAGGP